MEMTKEEKQKKAYYFCNSSIEYVIKNLKLIKAKMDFMQNDADYDYIDFIKIETEIRSTLESQAESLKERTEFLI